MKTTKNKGNTAKYGAEWMFNIPNWIDIQNYKNMGVQDNNGISMLDFAKNNMEYPSNIVPTNTKTPATANPLIYPSSANKPFVFKPQGIADIVPSTKNSSSTYTSPGTPSIDKWSPNPDNKNTSSFGKNLPYFIDNITNAITTSMTPNPIPPAMIPLQKLNTDVDVNPMINSIKGNERGNVRYVDSNISDSNVATAMKASIGNQSTLAINDVRSKEINTENEIKNKEVQLNLYPNMYNARAINDFGEQVVDRRLDINQGANKNIDNLSRDFIDIRDKKEMLAKDNRRMNILLQSDVKGVNSELIKSGEYDSTIFAPGFDPNLLQGANRLAYYARKATQQMNR
jgi:hypothetical protein